MKNTTKTTQKEQQMIDNYNNTNFRYLHQIYTKYSNAKQMAYNRIINEYDNNNGYDFRICTYNQNVFTCGYLIDDNGKKYLIYHTPTNKYKILYA